MTAVILHYIYNQASQNSQCCLAVMSNIQFWHFMIRSSCYSKRFLETENKYLCVWHHLRTYLSKCGESPNIQDLSINNYDEVMNIRKLFRFWLMYVHFIILLECIWWRQCQDIFFVMLFILIQNFLMSVIMNWDTCMRQV